MGDHVDRESGSLPSQTLQGAIVDVKEVQQSDSSDPEEEKLWAGRQGKCRKLKKQIWSMVKKKTYFPQCSKSVDHESISRPVLWLCGLSGGANNLLWIPSSALNLYRSPSHRNTHKHINPSPKTNSFRSSSTHLLLLLVCFSEVAKVSERYVCLFPLHWRVNSARCNKKWITHSLKGLCHSSLSWTNSKLISSRLISLCSLLNFR